MTAVREGAGGFHLSALDLACLFSPVLLILLRAQVEFGFVCTW